MASSNVQGDNVGGEGDSKNVPRAGGSPSELPIFQGSNDSELPNRRTSSASDDESETFSSKTSRTGSLSSDSSFPESLSETDSEDERYTSTLPEDLLDPESMEAEEERYTSTLPEDLLDPESMEVVTSTRDDLHIDPGTKEEEEEDYVQGTQRSRPPEQGPGEMLDAETAGADDENDDEKTLTRPREGGGYIDNMYDTGTKEEKQNTPTKAVSRHRVELQRDRTYLQNMIDKGTAEEVSTHGDLLMDQGTGQVEVQEDDASFEEEFKKEEAMRRRVDEFEMLMAGYKSEDVPVVGELFEIPVQPSLSRHAQIMNDIGGYRYETKYKHDMRLLLTDFRDMVKELVRHILQKTGSLKFSSEKVSVPLVVLSQRKQSIQQAYSTIGPFTSVQRLLNLIGYSTKNIEYNSEIYKTTITDYHQDLLQKLGDILNLFKRVKGNRDLIPDVLENVREVAVMVPYHAALEDTGIVFYNEPKERVSALLYFLAAAHGTLQRMEISRGSGEAVVGLNQNGRVFINHDNYAFPSDLYFCTDESADTDITLFEGREDGKVRIIDKENVGGENDSTKLKVTNVSRRTKFEEVTFEAVDLMTAEMLRESLKQEAT